MAKNNFLADAEDISVVVYWNASSDNEEIFIGHYLKNGWFEWIKNNMNMNCTVNLQRDMCLLFSDFFVFEFSCFPIY